jgi:hypothetical protein
MLKVIITLICKLNIPHIYYIINSYYSLLGTCIVLAVKYNEETCHFNERGDRFFFDSEFALAVSIPKSILNRYQLHFLEVIDHHLFVSEIEYNDYVRLFIDAARTLRQQRVAT